MISPRIAPYAGGGCSSYASGLSMCLRAAGAPPALCDPGLLECLTTMPFGRAYAEFDEGYAVFLPNSPNVDPHGGIKIALDCLGWSASESHADESSAPDPDAALSRLREALTAGPALLGPVGTEGLTYRTAATRRDGSGEYVVALAVEGGSVLLHDPAGYPYARCRADEFALTWRADSVAGKRGPYTLHAAFAQREPASRQTAVARAVPRIRALLAMDPEGGRAWGADGPRVFAGAEALGRLARSLAAYGAASLDGYLSEIVFPVAARRCLDAAEFLREGVKPKAAANMDEQAKLFGECFSRAARRDWEAVIQALNLLADLESRLHAALA